MSEEIKIEKGIKMPLINGSFCSKYEPVKSMKIGDSFVAPEMNRTSTGRLIDRLRQITGFNFVSKTVPKGIRVWRIA